jgi:lipopolysaccharide transport system ATP-binding protein
MLELKDVTLDFHGRGRASKRRVNRVLDNVSLRVEEGETLGVIGENGCGKTTILRLMAGIIAPTVGTVTQRPGASSALLSLGLGFRADLTGRDNAILSAMLQGATLRMAESFLDEIEEFSELGEAFDQPVKTYSSGMRSRLGFTTALITDVDILLIDEVLSVGDAHFRHKAQGAMKSRIRSDQTVVFVSHSSGQVRSLCDRAIWLNRGKIADEGDTKTVLANYAKHIQKADQARKRT